MSQFKLSKSFSFEASHQLIHHDGKCARLHGHSWKGELIVEGSTLVADGAKENMLIDYGDLSAVIKPIVEKYLDHHHLNNTLQTEMPTSEFIAKWIYKMVKPQLPLLVAVIIQETCTSRCEYSRR
jgi:6-pyruvoyltetrahydropterin/6-carboxytetrahydropterin synthase